MSDWTIADVWEAVADLRPDASAVTQGGRHLTWAQFEARADGLASALIASGLSRQAKVAHYLHNRPEYLESLFAILKAGMVPVNTNFRYTESELAYLWDNADAEAVVFEGGFSERIEGLRPRLPRIRQWWWLDDGTGECPPWATPYEQAAAAGRPGVGSRHREGRSGDDLLLIYTGGTTGMPKGVMWRQDDIFAILNQTAPMRYPEEGDLDDVRTVLSRPARHPPARLVPCAPLMHGTGLLSAVAALDSAGSIVLLEGRRFSPTELLDTIQAERVTECSIVGDAFAKPLLHELDAHPGRWDLSSLWLIMSSGVMWSAEVKAGLLRHHPNLRLVDTLGSSEAVGLARSSTTVDGAAETAGFVLGARTQVITEDGRPVTPGSGEIGLVATRGRAPVGYYKDPEKTAATFRLIDGVRWSIPGDWASVDADGMAHLLGRGSVCINTGGEKVFPEEVEEALKRQPPVRDAVVVGVPDDRFGEAVVAVVELEPLADEPFDEAMLIAAVKQELAGYKAPKRILAVASIGRGANGKADYRRIKSEATAALS
jgi:acyl-CoA synthetase (AMP-forming)/AMP-acid ligase II